MIYSPFHPLPQEQLRNATKMVTMTIVDDHESHDGSHAIELIASSSDFSTNDFDADDSTATSSTISSTISSSSSSSMSLEDDEEILLKTPTPKRMPAGPSGRSSNNYGTSNSNNYGTSNSKKRQERDESPPREDDDDEEACQFHERETSSGRKRIHLRQTAGDGGVEPREGSRWVTPPFEDIVVNSRFFPVEKPSYSGLNNTPASVIESLLLPMLSDDDDYEKHSKHGGITTLSGEMESISLENHAVTPTTKHKSSSSSPSSSPSRRRRRRRQLRVQPRIQPRRESRDIQDQSYIIGNGIPGLDLSFLMSSSSTPAANIATDRSDDDKAECSSGTGSPATTAMATTTTTEEISPFIATAASMLLFTTCASQSQIHLPCKKSSSSRTIMVAPLY